LSLATLFATRLASSALERSMTAMLGGTLVRNQLFAVVFCGAGLFFGSAPQPLEARKQRPEKPPKSIEERVKLLVNWGEPISTPGAKVEMREVKRREQNGKLAVDYDVYVSGLPADQSYSLFQFPITVAEPQLLLPQVFFGQDGKLCLTPSGCQPPVQFGFLPGKGEPFRLLLISRNGKSKVATMVVPDPIVGADQGCTVEAVRIMPKFEAALLRGKGFGPKEEIQYTSRSAEETIAGKVRADEKGLFFFVLLPSVKGNAIGTDTVSFQGKTCAPSVSYRWGTTD
jgi:hypothetical protein